MSTRVALDSRQRERGEGAILEIPSPLSQDSNYPVRRP